MRNAPERIPETRVLTVTDISISRIWSLDNCYEIQSDVHSSQLLSIQALVHTCRIIQKAKYTKVELTRF